MTVDESERWQDKFSYSLALIADCDIDRPRRHRINPRVVKVKMSKFKRKNKTHKYEKRNLEQELKIVWGFPGSAMVRRECQLEISFTGIGPRPHTHQANNVSSY